MGKLILFLIVIGFFLMANAQGNYDNPFKKEGLVGNIMVALGVILSFICF
jgi:hypothetical protein